MGDKSAQGRALGNLGNIHYLLGNFKDAIAFHTQVSFGYFLLFYLLFRILE